MKKSLFFLLALIMSAGFAFAQTGLPPSNNAPGVHVSAMANGDPWSGANIILGSDAGVWPWSTAGVDGVAFTPVKDETYHMTFNVTSTSTSTDPSGFRIRWINDDSNGGYTAGDVTVVNDHVFTADQIADFVPAYFENTINSGETMTYSVDFTMDGSQPADTLVGNLAIRGQSGDNNFVINTLQIRDIGGNMLVNYDKSAGTPTVDLIPFWGSAGTGDSNTWNASTQTMTTASAWNGGVGAWFGTPGKDLSPYNEVVVNFEPVSFDVQLYINYNDGTGNSVTVPAGATSVTALLMGGKDNVKQINIQTGEAGSVQLISAYADKNAVNVTGVSLDKTTASMNVGDVAYLTATIAPANATDQQVIWSSSDPSIVTVSAEGPAVTAGTSTITAVGTGTATITATTEDGSFVASCAVTVTIPASVDLIPFWGSAGTWQTTNTWDATNQIMTTTDGYLGGGVGAWFGTPGKDLSPYNEVVVNFDQVNFDIWLIIGYNDGTSNNIYAPAGATSVTAALLGGKDNIMQIYIQTSEAGSVHLLSAYADKNAVNVTGVSLDKTTASMNVGDVADLTASILPYNATDGGVIWSSSNPAIVTVPNDGAISGTICTITAVGAGTATITVTTEDGSYSASCTVTVTFPDVLNLIPLWGGAAWDASTQTLTTTGAWDGGVGGWCGTPGKDLSPYNEVVVNFEPVSFDVQLYIVYNDGTSNSVTVPAGANSVALLLMSGKNDIQNISIQTSAAGSVHLISAYADKNAVNVTGVSLDITTTSMNVGDVAYLTATITPANATDQQVIWSSSDPSIVTVSAEGPAVTAGTSTITAVGAGTATITATTEDGSFVASCAVTVSAATVPVTGISIAQTTAELIVGNTLQLTATVEPANATNQNITWSSSDESVATVSGTGLITAISEGTATITATTEDGNFTATCTVTVARALNSDASLSGLSVSEGTLTPAFSPSVFNYTVSVGADVTSIVLSATANDTAASVAVLEFSSDGTATLKPGDNVFEIIVTAENGNQQVYTVTVNRAEPPAVAVTGISLDNSSVSMWVNETQQLTATVAPSDATNQNVSWSSSDETVATVSNAGLITATGKGTATITATTEDGSFTASCKVEVLQQEVIIPDSTQTDPGGKGMFVLSLTIPTDVLFSGSFLLTLPNGVQLDLAATRLTDSLATQLTLNIVQVSDSSWTFNITPQTLRSAKEMVYSQLVEIGYIVNESVAKGTYDAFISDLSFEFADGTIVEESKLPVQFVVTSTTGIPELSTEINAYLYSDRLYIESPVAETVQVYSVNGVLLYNFQKLAGRTDYLISQAPGSVLVVKGSSGWVKKVIR